MKRDLERSAIELPEVECGRPKARENPHYPLSSQIAPTLRRACAPPRRGDPSLLCAIATISLGQGPMVRNPSPLASMIAESKSSLLKSAKALTNM